MINKETELYFDGMPTEPDISRILDKYPLASLKEGAQIPRTDIARIARSGYGSTRHNTVEAAFRRQLLRDHNIMFSRSNGMLTVLDPEGRVHYAGARQTTGKRMVVRAGKLVHSTDMMRLPTAMKKLAEHQIKFAGVVAGAARVEPKRLKAPNLNREAKRK